MLVKCSNSARCYGCELFGVAPSFKEARDFQAEQRERAESGDPLFRGTDVRGLPFNPQRLPPTRLSPLDGGPPTRLIFHAVNLSA